MSFTYDGSNSLRNLFNIKDYKELELRISDASATRIIEIELGLGPKPTFDQNYLQEIHRYLF